jgi:zinc protease
LNISGAGPLYEPADLPGLAYVTAQMLNEGTTAHTSKEIAEELEKRGVAYNAFSSFGSDAAVIRASGLSDNLDEWFALVSEVALNPTFPADELNNFKQRMKVQWQVQRSSSAFLANERLSRAVFGQHPAAVMLYTPESLGAFTSEMLTKWHHERYVPQNAILGIVGDVRADELIPKLKKWLAGWRKTDLKPVLPPNPTPAAVRKIYLVDRSGSAQTTIAIGNLTIDRRDPDYLPMVVLNRVLGDGPAARLFIKLREEKGYTHNVSSSFTALKYPGAWRAISDTRPEMTEAALAEFFNEIRRLSDERLPQAELEDAERSVAASFALSLEQPAQLLSYAITRKVYGFSADYWDTYPAKVLGVSADDIQRLARQYLNPDAMQVVAVGDRRKIQRALEKYGPVEVYDTQGRPITAKTVAAR